MNGLVTDPVTMAYHELRSPLALMATIARSAAEECPDETVRRRCLSIVRTAERMLRTAGNVMVVAGAAQDESLRPISPSEVAIEVVRGYEDMGVAIRLEASDVTGVRTIAARGQLEALLCSVIGNALDHGTADFPVTVTVEETAEAVSIFVSNSIDESGRHKGIGLGTYIGSRLAQALNATLEFGRIGDEFVTRIGIPAGPREQMIAL